MPNVFKIKCWGRFIAISTLEYALRLYIETFRSFLSFFVNAGVKNVLPLVNDVGGGTWFTTLAIPELLYRPVKCERRRL